MSNGASCSLLHKPEDSDLINLSGVKDALTKLPKPVQSIGLLFLGVASCALLLSFSTTSQPMNKNLFSSGWDNTKDIKVAFIGNSIQYYNDFPRLMEAISGYHVTQNSCLRGGASLSTIVELGNGMMKKFNSSNAKTGSGEYDIGAPSVYDLLLGNYSQNWDYIVLNDRTVSEHTPLFYEYDSHFCFDSIIQQVIKLYNKE